MQVVDGISRRGLVVPMVPLARPRLLPLQPPRGKIAIDGIQRIIAAEAHPMPTVQPTVAQMVSTPAAAAPALETTTDQAAKLPIANYLMAGSLLFASLGVGAYIYTARAQATTKSPAVNSAQASSAATNVSTQAATGNNAAVIQGRLQSLIGQVAANFGAPVSISVYDLTSGAAASTNLDTTMVSASLYKLFVAEAVYRAIDSGRLTYGTAVPGTGSNVSQCLSAMITVSDNTCGEALGSLIGWQSQNNTLHTSGYTHTNLQAHSDEITSASDVSLLLKKLYDGTSLSPNSTQNFLGLLKAQTINNRLPVGLPAGTVVAHKTGDLDGLVHDAGIVYGPKGAYVITIMSGPWSSVSNAPAAFTSASQQIYQSLQQ